MRMPFFSIEMLDFSIVTSLLGYYNWVWKDLTAAITRSDEMNQ